MLRYIYLRDVEEYRMLRGFLRSRELDLRCQERYKDRGIYGVGFEARSLRELNIIDGDIRKACGVFSGGHIVRDLEDVNKVIVENVRLKNERGGTLLRVGAYYRQNKMVFFGDYEVLGYNKEYSYERPVKSMVLALCDFIMQGKMELIRV